jgi:hypothetical protein
MLPLGCKNFLYNADEDFCYGGGDGHKQQFVYVILRHRCVQICAPYVERYHCGRSPSGIWDASGNCLTELGYVDPKIM